MSDENKDQEPIVVDDADDLEAQLAALGLFGESDDTDFDDSFMDDDDPEAAFAALEALNLPEDEGSSEEMTPMFSADSDGGMDLDKQLEALLMADQTATEAFNLTDLPIAGPVQSVYDPETDGMGVVSYVKGAYDKDADAGPSKLFENVTWLRIAATAIIGLIIIVTGAVTTIMAATAILEHQQAEDAVAHFLPISIPENTANNANAIFLNHSTSIGDQTFTLSRIVTGYSGTYFYFRESFDVDDYIFLLYNQGRNLIARTTFNIAPAPNQGSVLRFGYLPHNTLFLTLYIQCRQTHQQTSFNYRMLNPPTHVTPVYNVRPIGVMSDSVDMGGLVIRSAVFDNASSTISYTIHGEGADAGLRMTEGFDVPLVTMQDIFSTITPLTSTEASVHYDEFDITMGSAVFGPVFSLDSRVDVIFHGLSYFHPDPEVSITPSELFYRDQWDPYSVEMGEHTLNLEAMGQQGTLVILVLHGLDGDNRRQRTSLDVELRISTDNGVISIPGQNRIHPLGAGTDVLFELSPYLWEIRDVHLSRYSLVIHSAEIEVPTVTASLHLNNAFETLPSLRLAAAYAATHEAFSGLLSYKSGGLVYEGLTGLSPELKSDGFLLDMFAQRTDLASRPMYSASVVVGSMVSNYDFLSVVEVQWVVGSGSNMEYFQETFQVTSRSTDGVWSVVDISVVNRG